MGPPPPARVNTSARDDAVPVRAPGLREPVPVPSSAVDRPPGEIQVVPPEGRESGAEALPRRPALRGASPKPTDREEGFIWGATSAEEGLIVRDPEAVVACGAGAVADSRVEAAGETAGCVPVGPGTTGLGAAIGSRGRAAVESPPGRGTTAEGTDGSPGDGRGAGDASRPVGCGRLDLGGTRGVFWGSDCSRAAFGWASEGCEGADCFGPRRFDPPPPPPPPPPPGRAFDPGRGGGTVDFGSGFGAGAFTRSAGGREATVTTFTGRKVRPWFKLAPTVCQPGIPAARPKWMAAEKIRQ